MSAWRYRLAGAVYSAQIQEGVGAARIVEVGQDDRIRRVLVEMESDGIVVEGVRRRVHIARDEDTIYIAIGGEVFEVEVLSEWGSAQDGIGGDEVIYSPMPGQIISVHVRVGDRVQAGDTLIVLESMKLHSNLAAPIASVVTDVAVEPGSSVEKGKALVRLAAEHGEDHAPD